MARERISVRFIDIIQVIFITKYDIFRRHSNREVSMEEEHMVVTAKHRGGFSQQKSDGGPSVSLLRWIYIEKFEFK